MKSKNRVVARRALSVAFLVLCLLVTSFASVHSAQAQSAQESGYAVRIWVRKLTSGNLEFGLTEGARVRVPDSRYLVYATAKTGKWYYSNREDVGPGEARVRVRIRARKLATGNVEFGLRVAESEVWVPQARYFLYASTSPSDDPLYSSIFYTGPSRGCGNGIAVPAPLDHAEYIEDCNVVLAAFDSLLAGHRYREGNINLRGFRNGGYLLSNNTMLYVSIEHPSHEWTIHPGAHIFGWRTSGSPPPPFPSNASIDRIRIQSRPLGGTLPPELFSELELSAVRIAYTNLWGQIPSTLFDSTNLLRLDLSGNAFTGVTLEPFTG